MSELSAFIPKILNFAKKAFIIHNANTAKNISVYAVYMRHWGDVCEYYGSCFYS